MKKEIATPHIIFTPEYFLFILEVKKKENEKEKEAENEKEKEAENEKETEKENEKEKHHRSKWHFLTMAFLNNHDWYKTRNRRLSTVR